jgi:hypothetical protein
MARIAEEKGVYGEAEHYYERSVHLFTLEGRKDDAAMRKVSLAASARGKRKFTEAYHLLEDALKNDRDDIVALALYHKAKILREEARSLQIQGAYSTEFIAKFDLSIQTGYQALDMAKKVEDAYLIARILLDIAVTMMLYKQKEDTESIEALRKILEENNYTREEGRLIELLGDLAYIRQDFTTAFNYYVQAGDLLFTYNKLVFDQTFKRVRGRFFDLSPEIQQQICQLISEKAASDQAYPSISRFQRICEDAV